MCGWILDDMVDGQTDDESMNRLYMWTDGKWIDDRCRYLDRQMVDEYGSMDKW